jgi:hypothetical protein
MAVSAIFSTRRSWAANDLAIEHRSRGVQKMMGYLKSKFVTVVTVAEAGSVERSSGGRYGSADGFPVAAEAGRP